MVSRVQFRVPDADFDCDSCTNTVEQTLRAGQGVERIEVDDETGIVDVVFDPDLISPDSFERVIRMQGYTAWRTV